MKKFSLLPVFACSCAVIAMMSATVSAQMGGPNDPFTNPNFNPTAPPPLPPGMGGNTPTPAPVAPTPKPAATPKPTPAVGFPTTSGTSGVVAPSVSGIVTPSGTGNTIVNPGQKARATKRGVCENHLSAEDFKALAPGVSWYYNWSANSSDTPPGGVDMEFIPMAWGRSGDAGAVAGAIGRGSRAVLAINEPNLKGQAFMSPEDTARLYKQIAAVADPRKVPVIGPNMALGSGADASVEAVDPFTKKKMVYTSMEAFLKAFYFYHKEAPGSLGMHAYGDMGDLQFAVSKGYELTRKPVWVTEFAFWNAKDEQDELRYMKQAVEFLENSQQCGGYAWFKERVGENKKISLLDKSGKLTPLGELYVKLPTHNVHVFYRIPSQIEAGSYVTRENMTLEQTSDASGDFDMVSDGNAGTVDYNIQVDEAGTYALKIRASVKPGKIEVMQNDQVLGSVTTTKAGWETVETQVPLLAGAQTIRLRCTGQTLHFLDFAKK